MTDADTPLTLLHPFALLAEPAFGAPIVALLPAGAELRGRPSANGFVQASAESGPRGYLPAALCAAEPPARPAEPRDAHVAQTVALYRAPAPGQQYGARWLVQPGERLRVLGEAGMFRQVQRPDGQIGYVPATLCKNTRRSFDNSVVCELVQTVSLYASPAPGAQFESHWQIDPSEPLLELGRAERFVLIQRESGELGYVPAALVGQHIPEALVPVGPFDLGWIAVGGGWALVNWTGLALAIGRLVPLGTPIQPALGLAIVLGVAATIWLASHRRMLARSFALGMLLAYALMHFSSSGQLTLWR